MNALHARLAAAALCALFAAGPVIALEPPATARPKIGLVLGGGGARGGAHLGVLEVLEQLHVPVDCVAGTSMGALFGGAWLAGVSPAQMRETIAQTDWASIFEDSGSWETTDFRNRSIDSRFVPGLEFGVVDRKLRYREGAVAGVKIKLFFNQLVRADLGERNIEDLPLPLTLIATDIGTGERVAMRSGNLASAMRASMAVPGAIAPLVRDGRKLVDGGLVDNLPVAEVRERCNADVVIAVNVGSPMLAPDEVNGVFGVVGQVVLLLTEQNVAKSMALLDPKDIYIRPELGALTSTDFAFQIQAAAIGQAYAAVQADRLRALAIPEQEYHDWREKLRVALALPPVVDQVVVDATRYVPADDVRARIRQKDGEPLDPQSLAEDIVRVYGEGNLQGLDYTILRERDKTILKLTPLEKAWGPDYLRFGLNMSSGVYSDDGYNLRALYRRTWLNEYAGEWLTMAQLGAEQYLQTEFYQPLDRLRTWFVRPHAAVSARRQGIYYDGDRMADYRVREDRVGLDVGANLGAYGQARTGWLQRHVRMTRDTGDVYFADFGERIGGLATNVAIDQYDAPFFPRHGYRLGVDYFHAVRVDAQQPRYGRLEARAGGAWSIADLTVLGRAATGRTTHGTLPSSDLFALGGLDRLSALAPGQLLGENYWFGSMQLQYRLLQPIPVIGLSALAGLSLERGRMIDPITVTGAGKPIDSVGAYLASNTPIGPLYVGYAWSRTLGGRFYFFVGAP